MSERYATSRDREFFLDTHGVLFQLCGFPDAFNVRLGPIDIIDPDEAPERIRPAIAELAAEWAARERREDWYAGLERDYRRAVVA